jgi:hypothetical protein
MSRTLKRPQNAVTIVLGSFSVLLYVCFARSHKSTEPMDRMSRISRLLRLEREEQNSNAAADERSMRGSMKWYQRLRETMMPTLIGVDNT